MNKQLVDIDKSVGQNQRKVGSYSQALTGFAAKFGLIVGGVALAKKAFESFVNGSQAMSDKWAITMGGMSSATNAFWSNAWIRKY